MSDGPFTQTVQLSETAPEDEASDAMIDGIVTFLVKQIVSARGWEHLHKQMLRHEREKTRTEWQQVGHNAILCIEDAQRPGFSRVLVSG